MKNKKGFTLVELLVTIALMLSILGLAIVSFIKISDRKKQEAYNLVKEQIITAAEQYFDSNEYLFEGLSDNDNSIGIITVGMLVEEDYLNKVTNPVTGQLINNCSQVQVTKKNGIYNSEFKEYSSGDNCESNYSVTITEPGAPSIELRFFKNGDENREEIFAGENGWFNKKVLNEKTLSVYVNGNKNGNGKISGIKMCITNDNVPCTNYESYITTNSSYEDNDTFKNDTKGKTACYKVINLSGKSSSKCIMAKVDKTPPELKYGNPKYTNYSFDDPGEPVNSSTDKTEIENGNWSTSNASFSVWTKDETSGINPKEKLFYIEWNDWGSTNGFECNDDGCLTNNITFKENDEGYNKILNNGNTIYVRDNGDLSNGKRKEKFTVCDEAGNCTSKAIYAKIDTTPPTITTYVDGSNWTNKDVSYGYQAEDNFGLSKVFQYWNTGDLTESLANSDTYKWNGNGYNNYSNGKEEYTFDGITSTKGSYTFSWQGVRKVRFKACDLAGNCTLSDEKTVRIDKTPPVVDQTGHGSVTCKNSNGGSLNYGFSIKFHDNLTRVSITYDYHSCNTSWSTGLGSGISPSNEKYSVTNFVSCSKNNLGFKYYLKDEAGNITSTNFDIPANTGDGHSGGTCICKGDNYWYNSPNNQSKACE